MSEITNTLFPPPPEYYKQFTDANIERLSAPSAGLPKSNPSAGDSLVQPNAEHDGLIPVLQKPRADWVREEGRWVVFGEISKVSLHVQYIRCDRAITRPNLLQTTPHIPGPADIGLTPLVEHGEEASLTPLLHSFLHTLLRLVDTLTNSARPPHELAERGWAHEGDQVSAPLDFVLYTLLMCAVHSTHDKPIGKHDGRGESATDNTGGKHSCSVDGEAARCASGAD